MVVLEGEKRMQDKTSFDEKLKTKLLDYATAKYRQDLEDLAAKLRALEEPVLMTSHLFSQQLQRGELGDDEAFLRWHALLEMHKRVGQRLALLLANAAT